MNKKQFMALGLSVDLAEKAAEASAAELKGYIPKARFDEVNSLRKNAQDELKDRDEKLEKFKQRIGQAESASKELNISLSINVALADNIYDLNIDMTEQKGRRKGNASNGQ